MAANRYGRIYHSDHHFINLRFPSAAARQEYAEKFEAYHAGHDHDGEAPRFEDTAASTIGNMEANRVHDAHSVSIDGYATYEIEAYHNPTRWNSYDNSRYRPPTCCVPPVISINRTFIDSSELTRHELSAIFMDMPEEDFENLLKSVEAEGFKDPVIRMIDEQVLDGWHRYRAAKELNLLRKLRFRQWDEKDEGDPREFAYARNMHRRHLSISLRSQIAVSFNKRYGMGRPTESLPNGELKSRQELAKEAGVSPRSIDRAITVENVGRADEVLSGEKTQSEIITEETIKSLWEEINPAISEWKKAREGVGHASKTMLIHASLRWEGLPSDTKTDVKVLKILLNLLTTTETNILEELVRKQLDGKSLWEDPEALAEKRQLALDAEHRMFNALDEVAPDWDTDDFIAAALDKHADWGVTELPDLDYTEIPAVWEGRYNELHAEITEPAAWIQQMLDKMAEPTEDETVESLWAKVSEEMPKWKARDAEQCQYESDSIADASESMLIEALRQCDSDNDNEGSATVEELKTLLKRMKADNFPLIVAVRDILKKQASEPSEDERKEVLSGEIKAYLPTWVASAQQLEPLCGNESKITLKLLLNAHFHLKHGRDRGGNSPLWADEMEEVLATLKSNDTAFMDKMRKVMEAVAPELFVDTESEQQATEQPKQTAAEREANKLLKQKKQAIKGIWDKRKQAAEDWLGNQDNDLATYTDMEELEKAFVAYEEHAYCADAFQSAMRRRAETSFNICLEKTLASDVSLEALEAEYKAVSTFALDILTWQKQEWIQQLIDKKKAKADAKETEPEPEAEADTEGLSKEFKQIFTLHNDFDDSLLDYEDLADKYHLDLDDVADVRDDFQRELAALEHAVRKQIEADADLSVEEIANRVEVSDIEVVGAMLAKIQLEDAKTDADAEADVLDLWEAFNKRFPKWKSKYAESGYKENDLIQAATEAELFDALRGYRESTRIGLPTAEEIQDLTELMKRASYPYARHLRNMLRDKQNAGEVFDASLDDLNLPALKSFLDSLMYHVGEIEHQRMRDEFSVFIFNALVDNDLTKREQLSILLDCARSIVEEYETLDNEVLCPDDEADRQDMNSDLVTEVEE